MKTAWAVVTPERLSAAWKLTVTVAGKPVTLIEVGVKPKVVRVGGVVSVVDVTASVLANPLAVKSAGAKIKVLPAASAMKTDAVQLPASLNRGKVTATESVTVRAGVRLLETV